MQEIKEELKLVLKGRTWDAIIPPIVFTALLNVTTLLVAALFALLSAAVLTVRRVINKQPIGYAAAGFLSVSLATLVSLYRQQAGDFFLPGFITSGFFNVSLLISVFIKKPFAALASHISRGWPLGWFWRPDIRPAYSEVTLFWFFFFTLRWVFQFSLYLSDQLSSLALWNVVLSAPAIVIVLIFSYLYGMARLRHLGGPSVEEYLTDQAPPYRGQRRGF